MKRWLILALASLALLTGCATTDVFTGQPLASAAPDGPQVDLLVQLANNPLIAAVLDDAAATQAWVDAQAAAGLDPIKVALARACPTAAQVAAKDFHDKVLGLKALIDSVIAGPGVDLSKPRLIYTLTVLKYGPRASPQVQISQLKADINLRLDAIFTGCLHLFPKKQAVELLNLAARAGILTTSGGAAAGLLPLLP